MRCVTAKPPNMLMVASAMATTASQRIHSFGRDRSVEIFGQVGRDLHQRADGDDATTPRWSRS